MTSHQSNSAVENLGKVTDGLKAVFTTALGDIRDVNHALREIVNSGDTLNPTGDLRVSSDVDNFKHAIRQRLSATDDFTQATRSAASYASDDPLLKSIKDELSKNSHRSLKSYLGVLQKRLRNCSKCLQEIKTNYSYIHSLGLQHKSRLTETSQHGRCATPTPATAGSGLVGLAGFFVAKLVFISAFESRALPRGGGGDSLKDLNKSSQQSGKFYVYEYNIILCLLFGVTIGIGCFYLAKRLGFHRLRSRETASFKEAGVEMLQLTNNSISDYLGKLKVTTSRIHELEQHLIAARDAPNIEFEDAELIKAQLEKLQHETNALLTFMD
jgi:hypothetical protein